MVTPLYRVRALTPAPALHSISVPFCSRLNRLPFFAITPISHRRRLHTTEGTAEKSPAAEIFPLKSPRFPSFFPFSGHFSLDLN